MATIQVKDSSNNSINIPITPIGQTTSVNSVSVTIASDQTNLPVNIATSLPTGTNTIGAVKHLNNPVGSDNFSTNQVSVASTSTLICSSRTGVPGTGRISLTLYNAGSNTVFIGNSSSVSTSTGQFLLAGSSITISTTSAVYGISSSGTVVVAINEIY